MRQDRIAELAALSLSEHERLEAVHGRQRFRSWAVPFAIFGGGALLGIAGTLATEDQARSSNRSGSEISSPPAPAGNENTARTGTLASGYIVATRRATVASEITGRLAQMMVAEGSSVVAGQPIAQLDPLLIDANVAAARKRVKAASDAIGAADADYDSASVDVVRATKLNERGFYSASDLDHLKARLKSLGAQRQAAFSQVEVARAEEAEQLAERERYVIRAPFSGIVTSLNAHVGEIISPVSAGGGFTRTGVCTIFDPDSLVVDADVREQLIREIRVGQPVNLTFDSYEGRSYRGEVIGITPNVARDSGTVTVRIRIVDKVAGILPDMLVHVTFLGREQKGAKRA